MTVFGSVARGEEGQDSDLDLLVHLEPVSKFYGPEPSGHGSPGDMTGIRQNASIPSITRS